MSQDKPVLTVAQIEEWQESFNWRDRITEHEFAALCDLALSALERQGWISVPRSLLRAAQLKCVDIGVQEAIHNFLTAPPHNDHEPPQEKP